MLTTTHHPPHHGGVLMLRRCLLVVCSAQQSRNCHVVADSLDWVACRFLAQITGFLLPPVQFIRPDVPSPMPSVLATEKCVIWR